MSDLNCKEQIFGDYRYHRCSRRAKKDGYCMQHHPDAVKTRKEKSLKAYDEKRAKDPLVLAKVKIKELEARCKKLEVDVKIKTGQIDLLSGWFVSSLDKNKELEIHAKGFDKIDKVFEGGEFHTADEMLACIQGHIVNHDNKMAEFNKTQQD